MMLNCRDTTFLISQQRERPLSFQERMRLRLHKVVCPSCANFERQLPIIGAAARAYADPQATQDRGKPE